MTSVDEMWKALAGIKIEQYDFLPKDQIWLVDSMGTVHKIINIGNLDEQLKGASLCIGEMK